MSRVTAQSAEQPGLLRADGRLWVDGAGVLAPGEILRLGGLSLWASGATIVLHHWGGRMLEIPPGMLGEKEVRRIGGFTVQRAGARLLLRHGSGMKYELMMIMDRLHWAGASAGPIYPEVVRL